MERVRTCTTCGSSFTAPRLPGRPPEKCSDECRVIAQRIHRRSYILRHYAAAPVAA